MQVRVRDERSSEPMSGEPLQVAPTLTRPMCRRAAQECSMHTVQRALAVRASVKCGGRRTFAGGMIKSAHGGRAETTVSMRSCSESCCAQEAASRGGYSGALPLTVCAFERRRKRVLRGRLWREKWADTRRLANLLLRYDRTKQPLSSFRDFAPDSWLASRQLGASMDLDAGAARRLREALDILASGELPECPVCKPPRA